MLKRGLVSVNIFQDYSDYYDLIYHDKNYSDECDFLELIFRRYLKKPVKTVLDLGCGTGGHALILANQGYKIIAVDQSEKMLKIAKRKVKSKELNVEFVKGDIKNINFNKKFDAVIAMFAVMSYQTKNKDIKKIFRTVKSHLYPGGLFIFDCWFGPAVCKIGPEQRFKIIEKNNKERIIRFVTPVIDKIRHTIKVNYKLLHIKNNRIIDEINETHSIRFLFTKEIKCYLKEAGFKLLKLCPFMKFNTSVTSNDWNITVIGKNKA